MENTIDEIPQAFGLKIKAPIKKFQLYLTPRIEGKVEGKKVQYLLFYGEPDSGIGGHNEGKRWYAMGAEEADLKNKVFMEGRIENMQSYYAEAGHDVGKINWNLDPLIGFHDIINPCQLEDQQNSPQNS